MKIVQTFCSFNQDILRSKFGWYSAYYHLASWSLSAHSIAAFHDVTLYTDEAGFDMLIRQLQLPYTNVIVSHNALHRYNKHAWALAKLHTFAQQREPFLHVDGDVYCSQPFDPSLLQHDIIVQNLERASRQYERNLNHAKDHLRYLPLLLHPGIKRGAICSLNAGIVGGHDLALFHELARLAFAIADKNEINHLPRHVLLNVNVVLEQVMLYRLLLQQDKKAGCLFDQVFEDFGYDDHDVADLDHFTHGSVYIHLIGGHKRSRRTCEGMQHLLQDQFPKAHARVAALFAARPVNVFAI